MQESKERFEKTMREWNERFGQVMRETQRAWRDLRSVGLSIVKTLNHHTRILERIDFGDHVGMVLEPFFAEADDDGGQLGFLRAKRIEPGHEA